MLARRIGQDPPPFVGTVSIAASSLSPSRVLWKSSSSRGLQPNGAATPYCGGSTLTPGKENRLVTVRDTSPRIWRSGNGFEYIDSPAAAPRPVVTRRTLNTSFYAPPGRRSNDSELAVLAARMQSLSAKVDAVLAFAEPARSAVNVRPLAAPCEGLRDLMERLAALEDLIDRLTASGVLRVSPLVVPRRYSHGATSVVSAGRASEPKILATPGRDRSDSIGASCLGVPVPVAVVAGSTLTPVRSWAAEAKPFSVRAPAAFLASAVAVPATGSGTWTPHLSGSSTPQAPPVFQSLHPPAIAGGGQTYMALTPRNDVTPRNSMLSTPTRPIFGGGTALGRTPSVPSGAGGGNGGMVTVMHPVGSASPMPRPPVPLSGPQPLSVGLQPPLGLSCSLSNYVFPSLGQSTATSSSFGTLGQGSVSGVEAKIRMWLGTIPIGNGAERGWDDAQIRDLADFAQNGHLELLDAEDIYKRYVEKKVADAMRVAAPSVENSALDDGDD